MAREKNKYVTITICAIILIVSSVSNFVTIKMNYNSSNLKQIQYLQENILENDIIICSDIINGAGVLVHFNKNRQYFYNPENWGVEEAYKAFGKQMTVEINLDFLEEYKGRIWLIDSENNDFYRDVFENRGDIEKISMEKFSTDYQKHIYNMVLLEKM